MAKNTEGGKGSSKSVLPEQHAAARQAARQRKRGRKTGLSQSRSGGELTVLQAALRERAHHDFSMKATLERRARKVRAYLDQLDENGGLIISKIVEPDYFDVILELKDRLKHHPRYRWKESGDYPNFQFTISKRA